MQIRENLNQNKFFASTFLHAYLVIIIQILANQNIPADTEDNTASMTKNSVVF